MSWTPERVELLKGYVAAGLTAAQACGKLDVTHRAAQAKAVTLGLKFAAEGDEVWTAAKVAGLKQLIEAGVSASQTAKALGIRTRNAVIGKAWRLGLKFRGTVRPNLYINQGVVRERAGDVDLPSLREVVTNTPPRPWLTRGHAECAWPVSGEGADTFSCCAPTGGAVYCEPHRKLMRGHASAKSTWSLRGEDLVRSLRRYA